MCSLTSQTVTVETSMLGLVNKIYFTTQLSLHLCLTMATTAWSHSALHSHDAVTKEVPAIPVARHCAHAAMEGELSKEYLPSASLS